MDELSVLVIEGLDGAGKSTLARYWSEQLRYAYESTPLSELRSVRAEVEAALQDRVWARKLWYAAQVAEVSERIRRHHSQGRSVVVDRYWLTTLAYAWAEGCAFSLPSIEQEIIKPNWTVFLDAPRVLRERRLAERGHLLEHDVVFLQEDADERLRKAYLSLSEHPVAGRFLHVLCGEEEPVEKLADRVQKAIFAGV